MHTYLVLFGDGRHFITAALDQEGAQEIALDILEGAGIVYSAITSIHRVAA